MNSPEKIDLDVSSSPIQFTIYGSSHRLVKTILLDDATGKLKKQPPSHHITVAEKETAPTLRGVMDILDKLSDRQAVGWGIYTSNEKVVPVVLADTYAQGMAAENAIARTKECLLWSNGPGIFMTDIDEDHDPDQARQDLIQAAFTIYGKDVLRDVEMYYRPSTSAGVYSANDELRSGGRIYFAVNKAGDIPTLGRDIADGLWINGKGKVVPSAAGTPLYRTLIDTTVWSPERIDYTGKAHLGEGVSRRHIEPKHWGVPGKRACIPSDAAPKSQLADDARNTALEQARPALAAARNLWVNEQVAKRVTELISEGMSAKDANDAANSLKQTYKAATEAQTLTPKIVLYLNKEMTEQVTVSAVIANPSAYHGKTCCDPLEPEGTFGKARIYTNGRPIVKSFLHGGTTYRIADKERVHVPPFDVGNKTLTIKSISRAIAAAFPNQLFIRAKMPTYVSGDNRLPPLDPRTLSLHLDKGIQFTKWSTATRAKPTQEMVPRSLGLEEAADYIAACKDPAMYDIIQPEIVQVVNRPMLIPATNRVISDPGYDANSKIYISTDGEFPAMPVVANLKHARELADGLLKAFSGFTIYNPDKVPNLEKALALTMILSASNRPMMVSPAFLIPAAKPGTGKTEMTKCIIHGTGVRMRSTQYSTNDAEATKIIATWAREQPDHLVIENHDHVLTGTTLEMLLDKRLDEPVDIRQLGENSRIIAYNTSLVIANGNNLRAGDGALGRRCLEVALEVTDPPPWAGREFQFGNPSEYILANWRMRHMTCLGLMHWFKSKYVWDAPPTRYNALPEWDMYVRQLVMALYGVDVAKLIVDKVVEINTVEEGGSPKGRVFEAAWEMCQTWWYSKLLTCGKLSEGNLEAEGRYVGKMDGTGFIKRNLPAVPRDVSQIMFTISQLKSFIAINNLDPMDSLGPVLKGAKGLYAAGLVHGMRWVDTGEMDKASNTRMWRIEGRPVGF